MVAISFIDGTVALATVGVLGFVMSLVIHTIDKKTELDYVPRSQRKGKGKPYIINR